jgi:hypothetical protein
MCRGNTTLAAKSFMGRSGNFSGDDILEIILQQPACRS